VSEESLRLDGNAAAGLLAEIFPFEMTGAERICANCGQKGPLGSLLLYGGMMGTILRCPTCDQVQLRIAHVRGRYLIDMRGMALLTTPAG
jgi:hypothetical protein